MTEQPDTAAIRAEIEQWGELAMSDWVEPLCDALDAACAERDHYRRHWEEANDRADQCAARAEAAEAKLKEIYRLVRIEHAKTDERVGELIYGPRENFREQIAT